MQPTDHGPPVRARTGSIPARWMTPPCPPRPVRDPAVAAALVVDDRDVGRAGVRRRHGRRSVRLLAHAGFSDVAVLLVMVATLPVAAIVPRMTDPERIRTG